MDIILKLHWFRTCDAGAVVADALNGRAAMKPRLQQIWTFPSQPRIAQNRKFRFIGFAFDTLLSAPWSDFDHVTLNTNI